MGGWLHGFLGWPIFWWWTVLLGAAIGLNALRPDPVRRRSIAAIRTLWGRWLWATQPCWDRHIEGLEHVGPGPYVIVANHRSVIDIPCLVGLGPPITVVAHSRLFAVPVLGRLVRWSGQVDTAEFDSRARAALAAGVSVLVFPEGTRSSGAVGRFQTGAFRLAKETGTPLMPVATDGAQGILARGLAMPLAWRVRVRVRVLPPVAPEGDPRDQARSLRDRIAVEVEDLRR